MLLPEERDVREEIVRNALGAEVLDGTVQVDGVPVALLPGFRTGR